MKDHKTIDETKNLKASLEGRLWLKKLLITAFAIAVRVVLKVAIVACLTYFGVLVPDL